MEIQTKNIVKFLILPLIASVLLVNYYARGAERDFLLHVDFYDVGQGDSFLITTYQGNQILVDGGPSDALMGQLSTDMGLYDRTIEMVILSHPHLDHFEGLISVLAKYNVQKILMPNVDYKSEPYQAFLGAAKSENAEIVYAQQGQRLWLDQGTALDILYPESGEAWKPGKNDDINDSSIVAKLTFGKAKMLLTGDSGIEIEAKLLPMFDLNADLLKVGHHGSKHSTSPEFLAEVTPEHSVIQVGERNRYNHPTQEILDRLRAANTKIYRNDLNGHVEFTSDGTGFKPSSVQKQ